MDIDPDRSWPGRVVPTTAPEVRAAVRSLIMRAHWPTQLEAPLTHLLSPWLTARWCVDAVIHGLDFSPDGDRHAAIPHRQSADEILDRIARRLRLWQVNSGHCSDRPVPRMPPIRGIAPDEWQGAASCSPQPREAHSPTANPLPTGRSGCRTEYRPDTTPLARMRARAGAQAAALAALHELARRRSPTPASGSDHDHDPFPWPTSGMKSRVQNTSSPLRHVT